jgi:phenylalanyl-tRNA synthetase beta chain
MPTIDVDCAELERLLGWKWKDDIEKLDEILALVKSEVKMYDEHEGIASIEIKDTNRPDLWSAEGLSRALRGFLKLENGLRSYGVDRSILDVNVSPQVSGIRPFICCSVVKKVKLSDPIIRGLMRLQDKLDQTYGRNRRKTSIGIYDFDLISPPLKYDLVKPNEVSFVPLGFDERMKLAEILKFHPKGLEYGHIVAKHSMYPILVDSNLKVLSFPPIINSNDLGRVTEETENVLVEVTGTMHQTVLNTLNLVTLALIDHGGNAHAATVHYPDDPFYAVKKVVTPDFSNSHMKLSVNYAEEILGLRLTSQRIANLLLEAGFGIESVNERSLSVLVPAYRVDVMHPVDLIEDVAIAYGYNNIKPLWRDLPTTGNVKPEQRFLDLAREFMVGLGFQEILTYTLTNPENLFEKMNREKKKIVEVSNPKVLTMSCLRNWLLPNLMEFFSNNQSVEFPQKIFELGKITLLDGTKETKTRDEEWLAAAITHPMAGFTEIKSCLDALFMNLGLSWQIERVGHPSFVEGRVGAALVNGSNVGVVGEVHPHVLEEWNLENPVAAFEVNIDAIFSNKSKEV